MDSLNEFPNVMSQARTDLAGNVSGDFSPENWASILEEANVRLLRHNSGLGDESSAWREVVREFHRERYWGFSPDWRPPPKAKAKHKNLGVFFIWMTFSTFVLTLIALVWLGQNYTVSDEPKDKYLFFTAVGLAIANFTYFLWHSRHYED